MRNSAQIKSEIEARLGFFPPFFEPALETPLVLENLWQQTLLTYLENPLPDLFKEKLAATLARYCSVPYCLMCHSASLRPLGMKATEVLQLLKQEFMGIDELEENISWLDSKLVENWPQPGSLLEDCLLSACVAIFLNQNAQRCHEKLRKILGHQRYNFLVSFLAYNRTCQSWAEAHPELSFEADERVRKNMGHLLDEEPALKSFFADFRGTLKENQMQRQQELTRELQRLSDNEKRAMERLRDLQQRFDKVKEVLTVGVLCVDFSSRRLTADETFKSHFGLNLQQDVNIETLSSAVDKNDLERARVCYDSAVRLGETAQIEVKIADAANPSKHRIVSVAGWASYDKQGRPERFDAISFREDE